MKSTSLSQRTLVSMMFTFAVLANAGCSASVDGDEGELGSEEGELTTALAPGSAVVTTTRVNFRTSASLSSTVKYVLPAGAELTVVTGEPEEKFYEVRRANGDTGYVYGTYIREVGGSSTEPVDPGNTSFPTSGDIFRSRGTGYYPDSSAMEGGFVDRRGARLRTLQGFLSGQHEYVSVAMDTNAFAYGTKLRIKEFEAKYGRRIEFRVVDTGGAFRGRGRSRMDICTANQSASLDATVNGMLTVVVDR